MTEDTMEARIDNWKRWALSGGRSPCVCQSIECRYIPPPIWHPVSLNLPVDIKDALAMEKAITAIPMPHKGVFLYYRLSPGINPFKIAKKLDVKRWGMDELYSKALMMLCNMVKPHG